MEYHTTENYLGHSRYCRTRSSPREQLEYRLQEYYRVNTPENKFVSFVFPSGMSAISTILQALSDQSKSIVIGNELYCDSPKVAKYLTEKGFYKSTILFSNIKDTDTIQLIHLETCSNPSGHVLDYNALSELKKKHNCIISLDNTWLSGASFNPIEKYGDLVDIVVESMSKYISNGKCIGGMCIAKKDYESKLFSHIRMYGIHVSPQVCNIVCETLKTVDERMKNSSMNTRNVMSKLESVEITYPHKIDVKYNPR